MQQLRSKDYNYQVILSNNNSTTCYPLFRGKGDIVILNPSPLHGRSYVVGRLNDNRFVVSKGNGLCYSHYSLLHTGECFDDTWGLLLRQDAERDFFMGQEIEALGIKTNHMEYVFFN